MSKTYPPEFRERALRLLAEVRADHPSDWAALTHIAGKLGVNPEPLWNWTRAAQVDARHRPGLTSEAQAEIARLKKLLRDSSARARVASIKLSASALDDGRAYTAAKLPLIEDFLNDERAARGLSPTVAWGK